MQLSTKNVQLRLKSKCKKKKKKMQIFVFGEALSPANYSRKQCQLLVLKYVTMVIHEKKNSQIWSKTVRKICHMLEKQQLQKFVTCLFLVRHLHQ